MDKASAAPSPTSSKEASAFHSASEDKYELTTDLANGQFFPFFSFSYLS